MSNNKLTISLVGRDAILKKMYEYDHFNCYLDILETYINSNNCVIYDLPELTVGDIKYYAYYNPGISTSSIFVGIQGKNNSLLTTARIKDVNGILVPPESINKDIDFSWVIDKLRSIEATRYFHTAPSMKFISEIETLLNDMKGRADLKEIKEKYKKRATPIRDCVMKENTKIEYWLDSIGYEEHMIYFQFKVWYNVIDSSPMSMTCRSDSDVFISHHF